MGAWNCAFASVVAKVLVMGGWSWRTAFRTSRSKRDGRNLRSVGLQLRGLLQRFDGVILQGRQLLKVYHNKSYLQPPPSRSRSFHRIYRQFWPSSPKLIQNHKIFPVSLGRNFIQRICRIASPSVFIPAKERMCLKG